MRAPGRDQSGVIYIASRRMISTRIVTAAKFIKMPSTSQNLYFHLIIHADDDGIVEALPVLNLIRANEDDLRVLHSKGFITILNEDLVSFINDWLEHNKIRLDRKVDSIYLSLLLSVVPDAKIRLKEPDEIYVSQLTDKCQTDDGQMSAQDSIGKDSIVQDRIVECSVGDETIAARLGDEILTKEEYLNLKDRYSEVIVNKVLKKILDKQYTGCLNYQTIDKWCDEQFRRTRTTDNFSHSGERKYDYEALEKILLSK